MGSFPGLHDVCRALHFSLSAGFSTPLVDLRRTMLIRPKIFPRGVLIDDISRGLQYMRNVSL